jgi:hypothetical protein
VNFIGQSAAGWRSFRLLHEVAGLDRAPGACRRLVVGRADGARLLTRAESVPRAPAAGVGDRHGAQQGCCGFSMPENAKRK